MINIETLDELRNEAIRRAKASYAEKKKTTFFMKASIRGRLITCFVFIDDFLGMKKVRVNVQYSYNGGEHLSRRQLERELEWMP